MIENELDCRSEDKRNLCPGECSENSAALLAAENKVVEFGS